MTLLKSSLKDTMPSILIGMGVALAAPFILPAVAMVMRPVAKAAITGVMTLTDSLKEFVAEAGEQICDLVAEVKAERQQPSGEE